MRRAITLMQSAYCLDGAQLRSETIRDEAADMPESELKPLLHACQHGRFSDVQYQLDVCRRNGYPVLGGVGGINIGGLHEFGFAWLRLYVLSGSA